MLFELIRTCSPFATVSFHFPVPPEGLPGADSFSVYAASVQTTSDLSQAVALDFTAPSGRASVPESHLSMSGPLPDPAPGDARYYPAAVLRSMAAGWALVDQRRAPGPIRGGAAGMSVASRLRITPSIQSCLYSATRMALTYLSNPCGKNSI
jgi:hypothetical protein